MANFKPGVEINHMTCYVWNWKFFKVEVTHKLCPVSNLVMAVTEIPYVHT